MLLVDHSSSMRGEKLRHAKQAASEFVSLMNLSSDQVGLVAFAADAEVTYQLTSDGTAVQAAIDLLDVEDGTDIAAAVKLAHAEVLSERHNPAAQAVIILLTDGRSAEEPALAAAESAKKDGIRVITIGLGQDVNTELLNKMATTGSNAESDYFYAPDSSALQAIYTQIAGTIHPCNNTNETPTLEPVLTPTMVEVEPTPPASNSSNSW